MGKRKVGGLYSRKVDRMFKEGRHEKTGHKRGVYIHGTVFSAEHISP